MSFGSPNNPYGQNPQNPQQPQQPQQPYGYPQQGQQPPGYGYPQAPGAGVPPQGGYGGYPSYPTGGPAAPGGMPGMPRVASMGRRFGARVLDGVAFMVIYFVLGLLGLAGSATAIEDCDPNAANYDSCMEEGFGDLFASMMVVFVIMAAIGLLYEWLLTSLLGGTLGKLAVGIRVVNVNTGQKIGLGSSFIRWIIPIVGSFACGIGQLLVYLSPFWDKSGRQQGWHDKAASTMVIQN
ncbi:RDD family protein [Streptomyces sp. B93]|uniref:RDD family protein n=1 Tax=Streptomyces sp. B93 TaxID=2824875 RepID=UPI001B379F73|nr:RDD family protein [Streptomyces sp. B93]MBQ1090194.1 RDD family protein [Streptomyces sp. B93]